ncbi:histidine ammonia-lyase [Kaistia dalseonensis]|uniref:Histidine ammonia-lyase n=2 Tax=Kaistia dalseonensis TaxID=410840 RepID=A0ABU0H0L4_9HYPH|nr:histidine ammonia-lyase [Kaistia dalseonensis]
MRTILLDQPLGWRDIAAIAEGADILLADPARQRIATARAIVETIVARGIRAYGVNTGVGALSDVAVDRDHQRQLSRNLLMSHACGVGERLGAREVRAIIAAQVNNYAHGHSGVRPAVVDGLIALLQHDCIPDVPARGSVGYLTHMAHIALVLIGEGRAHLGGEALSGAEALARIGIEPLVLEAKEGLSLVNGTPCATGLASLALARSERLLDWADATAAMSFENLHGQPNAFDAVPLALRVSAGLAETGRNLRERLAGSEILAATAGARTQDALSLRAVPHVHGAARDSLAHVGRAIDQELASVTDNPAIAGTPEAPLVYSEAHAVSPALGLAMDSLGIAVAEVAAMAERRLDRLVNPLVSGLPAFLAGNSGVGSGFMIAQYTAVALVNENRRLAAPASLDGGITSALQEDHLSHATPAATKALAILDNAEAIVAIELMAAAQAYEFQEPALKRAPGTDGLYRAVRAILPPYADDRPLADDMAKARALIRQARPAAAPPLAAS